MSKQKLITWSVVVLVLAVLLYWWTAANTGPSKLDGFAQCIKDKGATFYGAFWCPHCQAQKALFGSSAKLLPYVECAKPDGNGQNAVCDESKITQYPTWVFADNSSSTGELSLAELAQKTSCVLPQ